jgi:hypothetical protein
MRSQVDTTTRSRAGRARRLGAGALVAALAAGTVIVGGAAPAHAAPVAAADGTADWGVRASFRSYVTGPIASGSITTSDGATTNPDGTFRFPNGTGTVDADAGTLDASFDGTVNFNGHSGALDLTITDLQVSRSGDSGAITADVASLGLGSTEYESYPDVVLADLDFTGIAPATAPNPGGGADITFSTVAATLTADGSAAFAGFYPAGTALDPITFTVTTAAPPVWSPVITVSKSIDVDPDGETVTVSGAGFDPNANISTRPPVPVGMPSGVFVVFGRFADTWKPSEGAPISARTVIDQKWPLPAASKAAAEAAFGPNPQYVVLQPDGSFTTTLNLTQNDLVTGNYGIFTYAAGGAIPNPSQETFTPISFLETGTDAAADVLPFNVKGNKDTSRLKVEVSNVGANDIVVAPGDLSVTVEVNGTPVSDPVTATNDKVKKVKPGKAGTFAFGWAHGASLQAGDVVEVTACVDIADDDSPGNDCGSVEVPDGDVDLATATKLAAVTTKKSSATITTTVTNPGTAPVLLRPDDVDVQVFVNDTPVGSVTSKTELGKRSMLKPTKKKSYSFVWDYGSVEVGDVLRVETCVDVPGDIDPASNCSETVVTVVR